ncbi:hypothetical protein DEU56DRAFT_885230 [Suillus clintonianus]|uniref:uncharacterized protein n=1 Tax=Suillus clintonianus TaxID=1904413 RepID=UPI001B87082A|nr:uncharacterized protein DEU56DRAFT_885230 [Suillus clintonianus]KAG2141960.1 hypothetical protein DEU56DRAFT_885230 [Suillus clintonianus]
MTRHLAKKRREREMNFDLTVRWVPGHTGVMGNELADVAAKEAAEGEHQNSAVNRLPTYLQNEPLPDSVSALKQWHDNALQRRWTKGWERSPRYARTKNIDPSLPSNKFIKLVANLQKRQTSIYTQLRTHHLPLNRHLHRLGKSKSPHCPLCPNIDETVHHYLFDCPQYVRERHFLANSLRRQATSISYILTSEKLLNRSCATSTPREDSSQRLVRFRTANMYFYKFTHLHSTLQRYTNINLNLNHLRD